MQEYVTVASIHSIVAQAKAQLIFESVNFQKYLNIVVFYWNLLASFISWSSILTIRCDHIMSFQSLFLDTLP
jgi:hypothetical protein